MDFNTDQLMFFKKIHDEHQKFKGSRLEGTLLPIFIKKKEQYILEHPDSSIEAFVVDIFTYLQEAMEEFKHPLFDVYFTTFEPFDDHVYVTVHMPSAKGRSACYGIMVHLIDEETLGLDTVKLNPLTEKWEAFPSFELPIECMLSKKSCEFNQVPIRKFLISFYETIYQAYLDESF